MPALRQFGQSVGLSPYSLLAVFVDSVAAIPSHRRLGLLHSIVGALGTPVTPPNTGSSSGGGAVSPAASATKAQRRVKQRKRAGQHVFAAITLLLSVAAKEKGDGSSDTASISSLELAELSHSLLLMFSVATQVQCLQQLIAVVRHAGAAAAAAAAAGGEKAPARGKRSRSSSLSSLQEGEDEEEGDGSASSLSMASLRGVKGLLELAASRGIEVQLQAVCDFIADHLEHSRFLAAAAQATGPSAPTRRCVVLVCVSLVC